MKNRIVTNIPQYDGIGVYALINNRSGKMYIGSSINVNARILQHDYSFQSLNCSKKFIHDIQQGDTFSAKVIEKCHFGISEYELRSKEFSYMKQLGSLENGYNYRTNYLDPKLKHVIIEQLNARKNLKRIPLDVQKDKYDEIKAAADSVKESVNGYIKKAIDERMEREKPAATEPVSAQEKNALQNSEKLHE